MKKISLVLCLFILTTTTFPQLFSISGNVADKNSDEPLAFANIRVLNTSTGTTSNKNGNYELKLNRGSYQLAVTFIGYLSDTVSIYVDRNYKNINFQLVATKVTLSEIIIHPGENPAVSIIRKAILRKNERNRKLKSYEFDAYTKGIIKTQEDISAKNNSAGLGIGINDTIPLKITGILENQSKGFYKKPDNYKEIIMARKQSANFPSSVNMLTGGRLIQNFYENNVSFFGRYLPGPLSENALSYYYFNLEKQTRMDNKIVYQIYMTPDNSSDPGFSGRVFITDSSFDLIKVDLKLNRSANTGGIFDTINIYQQFAAYQDNIFMPVDYRLALGTNLMGLAKIGFELNTILYDYKINPDINDNFFNKAVITVVPDADKKDSSFWNGIQNIPNTYEEQSAYKRIDSLERTPRKFWDNFSILSTRIDLMNNLSISAPLGMYHFNRVEGNTIDFGIFVENSLEERLSSSLNLSYGFSDKNFKKSISVEYLMGDYRTTKINFEAFNRSAVQFGNSDDYNDLTSTLLALFSKYEYRDYFYTKGMNVHLSGEIFSILNLEGGYINQTDNSAVNKSDFSFFAKSRTYRINPPINDVRINAFTGGFTLDFRDYIEDGLRRGRITKDNTYILLSGNFTYSNKNLLNSGLDFRKYQFDISGGLRTFRTAGFNFTLEGIYNDGTLPFQNLYSVPGNINLTSKQFTFRTLNVNEVIGENVAVFSLEHNFGDELFKLLRVPGLKDWEIQLNTYFNAVYSEIGNETLTYLSAINYTPKTLKHPFYEIGFGIGHILFPMQLEFTWRLNYRNENTFRISLNSVIF